MRKILLITLILFVSSFSAYGAEPEAEYVRKGVFEAYMQTSELPPLIEVGASYFNKAALHSC